MRSSTLRTWRRSTRPARPRVAEALRVQPRSAGASGRADSGSFGAIGWTVRPIDRSVTAALEEAGAQGRFEELHRPLGVGAAGAVEAEGGDRLLDRGPVRAHLLDQVLEHLAQPTGRGDDAEHPVEHLLAERGLAGRLVARSRSIGSGTTTGAASRGHDGRARARSARVATRWPRHADRPQRLAPLPRREVGPAVAAGSAARVARSASSSSRSADDEHRVALGRGRVGHRQFCCDPCSVTGMGFDHEHRRW